MIERGTVVNVVYLDNVAVGVDKRYKVVRGPFALVLAVTRSNGGWSGIHFVDLLLDDGSVARNVFINHVRAAWQKS
jgi:hypothetical protein